MTWVIRAAWLMALVFAAGCAGTHGPLYSETEPPRLLDGEIRMTTRWTAGVKDNPDTRLIACRGGQIACEYDTPRGRWEGTATAEDWSDLWNRLQPVAPWAEHRKSVDEDDPTGGPYHVVHMRVGERWSEFSSQQRADLVFASSTETMQRVQYTNDIVNFVSAHATTKVRTGPPPSATPESAPAAPRKP